MKTKTIILILWMIGCAVAYDNSSMTGPYKKVVNQDPIHAIHDANTAVWGDWFWIMLVAGPYLAMFLSQKSMHIATMWLTAILAAYAPLMLTGYVPTHIFYLLFVFWILNVVMRLLSPIWTH